jgi:hypothetical protein
LNCTSGVRDAIRRRRSWCQVALSCGRAAKAPNRGRLTVVLGLALPPSALVSGLIIPFAARQLRRGPERVPGALKRFKKRPQRRGTRRPSSRGCYVPAAARYDSQNPQSRKPFPHFPFTFSHAFPPARLALYSGSVANRSAFSLPGKCLTGRPFLLTVHQPTGGPCGPGSIGTTS